NNPGPVFQDHQGVLWAGSLDGGLSRFSGNGFTPLKAFARQPVSVLAEDSSGNLWAGTNVGAFRLQNGNVQDIYTTAQGLPADRIRCMFRDHAGRLWAGTDQGPAVFENGCFVQIPALRQELSLPISAIGETSDGAILLAVARESVYRYAGGSLTKVEQIPR